MRQCSVRVPVARRVSSSRPMTTRSLRQLLQGQRAASGSASRRIPVGLVPVPLPLASKDTLRAAVHGLHVAPRVLRAVRAALAREPRVDLAEVVLNEAPRPGLLLPERREALNPAAAFARPPALPGDAPDRLLPGLAPEEYLRIRCLASVGSAPLSSAAGSGGRRTESLQYDAALRAPRRAPCRAAAGGASRPCTWPAGPPPPGSVSTHGAEGWRQGGGTCFAAPPRAS